MLNRTKSLSIITLFSLFTLAPSVYADTTTINFVFPVPSPADVTITAGDSVQWVGASSTHPLQQVTGATSDTATTGGFSSTTSPFTFQFDTPGTYYYRCTNHGVNAFGGGMRGSITVQAAGGSPTPTATNTPDPNCPDKPAKPTLSAPPKGAKTSKSRVSLNWDDVTCATQYKVAVRKGKKNGTIVDSKTVTKSAYKTVALSKKQTYFWTVKACNSQGCSGAMQSNFATK